MDAEKTGAYLAMLRKAKGLTQQEIADRLGVSNKTISKWESGGGFPDITVLPALAELYGVTADDILAGETLTSRRRESLDGPLTAQRTRLLTRLQIRFDVCFVLALALTGVGLANVSYISLPALALSVSALWIGYILSVSSLRGGDLAQNRLPLFINLWRKLAVGTLVQCIALARMTQSFFYIQFFLQEQAKGVLLYPWVVFFLILGFWALFQWRLIHDAGRDARLLPRSLTPWLLWAALFLLLWNSVSFLYDYHAAPLELRLANAPDGFEAELAQAYARQLRPYLLVKQAALALGGVSGLLILGFRLKRRLWKKAALAQTAES